MAQNVGRLGVVLGLDTADFVKGLGRATSSLAGFVDKAKPAILGATAVMTGLIAKTIAYADEIMDVADANEVAISTVMALGSAVQSAGGKAENAGRMLSKLSDTIAKAADGTKSAQDSFKKVGISLNDIATMDTDEMLSKVIKNLSTMPDVVMRNTIATEIFGKAARNINWKQMGADIEGLKEKYKENEAGIKAMADSVDAAEKIFKTFLVAISKDVGEDLKTTADYLERIKDLSGGVAKAFGTVFEVIAVVGSDVAFVIERTFTLLNNVIDLGFTASKEKRRQVWADYAKDSERLRKELDAFQAKILDNSPKAVEAKQKESINRPVKDANASELGKQKAISEEFEKQQKSRLDAIVMQDAMLDMSEKQKAIYEAVSKIEEEKNNKLLDIDRQIADARAKDAGGSVIQSLEDQKAKVYELADAYTELAQRAIQENENRVRMRQLLTNEEKSALNSTLSNMEVLAQKNRSAFNAWKAMSIAMGIISTYESAISTYNSLSKIPIVGPSLGIAGAAIAIAAGMAKIQAIRSTQFQGRQKGGSVVGNTPYLVGEAGPEIVIPHRGGTVIPNNQLSSAMGQGGGVVYNGPYIANMSAIDTQSAMQFLAKNKDSVWAANQSASRSMPASRK